jgi:hypothetical protein
MLVECQECKHRSKIPLTLQKVIIKYPNTKIFCERCQSNNIGWIKF